MQAKYTLTDENEVGIMDIMQDSVGFCRNHLGLMGGNRCPASFRVYGHPL